MALREIFREATVLAEGVPPALQVAAFQAAVQVLVGQYTIPAATRRAQPVRRPKGLSRVAGTRFGPKVAVEQAVVAGFLDAPKNVGQLRAYLKAQGWTYSSKELAMSTLRLVRAGLLVRTNGRGGKYEYVRASAQPTAAANLTRLLSPGAEGDDRNG